MGGGVQRGREGGVEHNVPTAQRSTTYLQGKCPYRPAHAVRGVQAVSYERVPSARFSFLYSYIQRRKALFSSATLVLGRIREPGGGAELPHGQARPGNLASSPVSCVRACVPVFQGKLQQSDHEHSMFTSVSSTSQLFALHTSTQRHPSHVAETSIACGGGPCPWVVPVQERLRAAMAAGAYTRSR